MVPAVQPATLYQDYASGLGWPEVRHDVGPDADPEVVAHYRASCPQWTFATFQQRSYPADVQAWEDRVGRLLAAGKWKYGQLGNELRTMANGLPVYWDGTPREYENLFDRFCPLVQQFAPDTTPVSAGSCSGCVAGFGDLTQALLIRTQECGGAADAHFYPRDGREVWEWAPGAIAKIRTVFSGELVVSEYAANTPAALVKGNAVLASLGVTWLAYHSIVPVASDRSEFQAQALVVAGKPTPRYQAEATWNLVVGKREPWTPTPIPGLTQHAFGKVRVLWAGSTRTVNLPAVSKNVYRIDLQGKETRLTLRRGRVSVAVGAEPCYVEER